MAERWEYMFRESLTQGWAINHKAGKAESAESRRAQKGQKAGLPYPWRMLDKDNSGSP